MPVISRIQNFKTTVGGQQHSGWLPPGAANPMPTPIRDVVLNFIIEFDGAGYLLIVDSADGSIHGDTWHKSIDDAMEQAQLWYKIAPSMWEPEASDL
jgi:hypothetical protein